MNNPALSEQPHHGSSTVITIQQDSLHSWKQAGVDDPGYGIDDDAEIDLEASI